MQFFTAIMLAALLTGLFASAANCNSERSDGSVQLYQQVAAAVCNGSKCGSEFAPCTTKSPHSSISAWYSGNAKIHCWDAFNNIIGQCVEENVKGGGQWDWVKDGVDEHYFIRTN